MNDDIRLGVESIDTKHDEFITILSKIKTCKSKDFLPLFLDMIEHTKKHFSMEEEIMNTTNFYDKKEHFDEHETMLNEMLYFYEKAKKMPLFGKSYINDYAYEKFKRHVLNVDSQLTMFLKKKGNL